jgi:hypothetical protein
MQQSAICRSLVFLFAASAATLLVSVVALGTLPPKDADAAGRFRTVTKTFSNEGNIQILDGSSAVPYPSELGVGGFEKGRILDVNLTLKNFSHTHPEDTDVLLAHRGKNRTVMSDVGEGRDVSNITLVFDDEADDSLFDVIPLVSGTFEPMNATGADSFPAPAPNPADESAALKGFDGLNPNGTWSLYVVDDGTPDSGQFAGGWSLKIKAKVRR